MANTPSKNDRRAAAREHARQIAQAQADKQKAAKRLLYAGIAVVVAVVLIVVGVLIYQSTRPADMPAAYKDGAITLVKDGDSLAAVADPAKDGKDLNEGAPNVEVFLDYQCPACSSFESLNGEALKKLAGDGEISLTFHPVALLDSQSGGNRYSTRTANLMMCVVDSGQDAKFADLSLALFNNQPEEGGSGLDDAKLFEITKGAGVDLDAEIKTPVDEGKAMTVKDCVSDIRFEKYVEKSTKETLHDGLTGTPTVKINGKTFDNWNDQRAFFAEIIKAKK